MNAVLIPSEVLRFGGLTSLISDFVRPRIRPPTHSGRMTLKKLTKLLDVGFGQRHREAYKPWLRVTRRECSPCSTIGHLPATELRRLYHFRSLAERTMIILLRWLGAYDIRDQFPLWPWPHEHPSGGLPGMCKPRQRGLWAIARNLGIDHGTYIGTRIPYVASLDIMSTWTRADGGYNLIAFDCKPQEVVLSAPPGARVRERLELGRRYCKEAMVPHRLVHPELLPRTLVTNLDALQPLLWPGVAEHFVTTSIYQLVLTQCERYAYEQPASVVVEELCAGHGIDTELGKAALNLCLWRQDLDHDLSLPLELWNPLIPGGKALRSRLQMDWCAAGLS